MFGVMFTLLAALMQSLQAAASKKLSSAGPPRLLLIPVFVIAGVLLGVLPFIYGIPRLDRVFWLAAIPSALLNALGAFVFWEALRRAALSSIFPLITLTPFFSLITAAILLRELPSLQGTLGIALLIIGLIITQQKGKTLLLPHEIRQRRIALTLGVSYAFILALNVTLDRLAILHSSPYFYAMFFPFAGALPFLLAALIRPMPKTAFKPILAHRDTIFLAGLFFAGGILFGVLGLTRILASYFSAIKRMSVLFTLVWSMLIFKEKLSARILAGSALALVGTVLIALS